MRAGLFAIALLTILSLHAHWSIAGEVIGDTYISEKDGVIELTAKEWNIEDVETPGSAKIAQLSIKDPINGTHPSILVFRLGPPASASVTPEAFAKMLREQFAKQGAEMDPIETRRIAGKRVLVLQGSLSKDEGKAIMLTYLLSGEKSFYWLHLSSNVNAWDKARPKFDELMETVKY
jgi:hypothetical protein